MLTAIVRMRDNDPDYRSELIIHHNGEEIASYLDGGEPEDNTFGRDWSWVAGMIEKAYALGRNDVHSEHNQAKSKCLPGL